MGDCDEGLVGRGKQICKQPSSENLSTGNGLGCNATYYKRQEGRRDISDGSEETKNIRPKRIYGEVLDVLHRIDTQQKK